MAPTEARSPRLHGLDSLRGFAGLSVLTYHFVREYGLAFGDGDRAPWMDRYAHYGVEIFFVISGFVMFLTLSRSPSLWRFIVARIARLAPAFYTCLVITTVVLIAAPHDALPGPCATKFLANLTMAPELVGKETMDWSYWTLGYELVFYVMIGTLFVAGLMRRIDWFCLAWLIFSAAVQLALPHIPQRVGEILLIGYGQFFIIGIALCRFHTGEGTRFTGLVLAVAVALSLFGASWRTPTPGWLYAIVTLAVAGVAWLAITGRIPKVIAVPFAWVATISFPLFLIHQFIGYRIMAALRAEGRSHALAMTVATVASIALAILVYRMVEVPARPWIRRRLTRVRPAPIASDAVGIPAGLAAAKRID